MSNRSVVERLWELFEARRWEEAGELLAEDVVIDWPHTRERIRGRDNVIGLNRAYPGDWHITVDRVVCEGDQAVSHIVVEDSEAGTFHAASFFELEEGKIARAQELWVDPPTAEPPEWRAQWVEPM